MPIAAPRAGPYQYMALDGVDDFVRRANPDMQVSLIGVTEITSACWVFLPVLPAIGGFPSLMQVSSGGVGGVTLSISNFSALPGVYAEARSQSEAVVTAQQQAGSAPIRAWGLVSNTARFHEGSVELRVNGLLRARTVGSFSFPYFNPPTPTNSHIHGAFNTGGGGWLNALIGDSWIYPRALSAEEHIGLFNGVVPPGARAWLVPDGANNRLTDIVGTYHSDTVGGAPIFVPGGPWS